MIGRRDFISLMGGASVAWPLAAAAQQAKRLPVIAMVYSVGSVAEMSGIDLAGVNMRSFERGLRDWGWIDGRTVTIERQSTEGDAQRAAVVLAEVVARKPDVILLGGARWLHEAASRATRTARTGLSRSVRRATLASVRPIRSGAPRPTEA